MCIDHGTAASVVPQPGAAGASRAGAPATDHCGRPAVLGRLGSLRPRDGRGRRAGRAWCRSREVFREGGELDRSWVGESVRGAFAKLAHALTPGCAGADRLGGALQRGGGPMVTLNLLARDWATRVAGSMPFVATPGECVRSVTHPPETTVQTGRAPKSMRRPRPWHFVICVNRHGVRGRNCEGGGTVTIPLPPEPPVVHQSLAMVPETNEGVLKLCWLCLCRVPGRRPVTKAGRGRTRARGGVGRGGRPLVMVWMPVTKGRRSRRSPGRLCEVPRARSPRRPPRVPGRRRAGTLLRPVLLGTPSQ